MSEPNEEEFTTIRKLLAKTNKPTKNTEPRCKKRALLVGISYQSCDAQKCGHLKGAHNDVIKLAKILVKTEGYSFANIRVLADGCVGAHTKANKANILNGISWLVDGCVPGDFRVFAFSGHGFDDVKLSEAEDHKVYDQNRAVALNGGVSNHQRLRKIVYSREAIAPQDIDWLELEENELGSVHNRPVRGQREIGAVVGWQIDRETLLYDKELNLAFSDLPQGSTLTCFMDCCHSGRMLSLPIKLGGGGHRQMEITVVPRGASSDTVYARQELEALDIDPDIAELTTSLGSMLGLGRTASSNLNSEETTELPHPGDTTQSLLGVPDSESRDRGPASSPIKAAPHRPILEPTDRSNSYEFVDSKTLPAKEMMTNKIKARVFCWSAGHQRQKAKEDTYNGFFTKGFCEALEDLHWCQHSERGASHQVAQAQTFKPTYRQLLKQVETQVYRSNKEQFVQLWSSVADGEFEKEFAM